MIFLPDPYTHQFDSLGSLQQPWQLTLNLQASYEINSRATVTDDGFEPLQPVLPARIRVGRSEHLHVFEPPVEHLGAGWELLETPPVQLKYPYGPWSNQTEVGYTAVKQPFQLTVDLNLLCKG